MYEIYETIRNSKGIKDSDVAKGTGIPKSTFSEWKRGTYTPKQEKLQKIANYFGVSLEYLLTGKESSYNAENAELLTKVHADTELLNALKQYFELPDDRKKLIVDNINMLSGGKE